MSSQILYLSFPLKFNLPLLITILRATSGSPNPRSSLPVPARQRIDTVMRIEMSYSDSHVTIQGSGSVDRHLAFAGSHLLISFFCHLFQNTVLSRPTPTWRAGAGRLASSHPKNQLAYTCLSRRFRQTALSSSTSSIMQKQI